jgi:hypothetical protein
MAVPQEYQDLFVRWCAEQVPARLKDRLQVAYSIHGDQVTISERRPPPFPELDAAWTAAPVAQLRYNEPEKGLWRLYRPEGEDGWEQYDHPPSTSVESLLAEIIAGRELD